MQIQVKKSYEVPHYISTKVDGFCNHMGEKDTEEVENKQGYVMWSTFCADCGAEYNELDESFIV